MTAFKETIRDVQVSERKCAVAKLRGVLKALDRDLIAKFYTPETLAARQAEAQEIKRIFEDWVLELDPDYVIE